MLIPSYKVCTSLPIQQELTDMCAKGSKLERVKLSEGYKT